MTSVELALGKRLQKARRTAGLTQEQLCQKAGLAYSTLAKIERGAIKAPSVFTIASIAGVIGVSLDELAGVDLLNKSKSRSKSGVRFVYFDVNGCLVHFYQKAFSNLAADSGKPLETVETAFWRYNDEVCRGDISLDDFNHALAETLGMAEVDWTSYYLNVIEPVAETGELLRWTAEYYKVGLLTNIVPGLLDKLRTAKIIPDINYDAVVDSSIVGSVKPEARIYQVAQQLAQVKPEEILFIDDSRVNLTAADKLGWHVMWFDDYHAEESTARVKKALELA